MYVKGSLAENRHEKERKTPVAETKRPLVHRPCAYVPGSTYTKSPEDYTSFMSISQVRAQSMTEILVAITPPTSITNSECLSLSRKAGKSRPSQPIFENQHFGWWWIVASLLNAVVCHQADNFRLIATRKIGRVSIFGSWAAAKSLLGYPIG